MTKPNQVPMRKCVTHSFACDCRERLFLETAEKLAKANEEIEYLNRQWADAISGDCDKRIFKEMNAKLEASQSREAVLLEALKFYANQLNIERYYKEVPIKGRPGCTRPSLDMKYFNIARLAIAKHAEMKG